MSLHQLICCTFWMFVAVAQAQQTNDFDEILGFDCVRDEFVETRADVKSTIQCSIVCSLQLRCQAFATSTGVCRLFVFDKCSKNVRDCACTKRARIFVKQQHKSVAPGSLCPADYANDNCGVKYRVEATERKWTEQKAACDSDGGLSMMADAMDAGEFRHIGSIAASLSISAFYLGGAQQPGSTEPAGGWYWDCGMPVAAELWQSGEPSNTESRENVTSRFVGSLLYDSASDLVLPIVCECLSPFG